VLGCGKGEKPSGHSGAKAGGRHIGRGVAVKRCACRTTSDVRHREGVQVIGMHRKSQHAYLHQATEGTAANDHQTQTRCSDRRAGKGESGKI